MLDVRIKEYLSRIGIRKIFELDTALLEACGPEEGRKHIERLTELYDRSEERLVYGSRDTPYLYRSRLPSGGACRLPESELADEPSGRFFLRSCVFQAGYGVSAQI